MPYKFPRDPQNPADLIGRPITVGDYVVYPVGSSSPGMTVGRIIEFKFKRPANPTATWYHDWIDCPQDQAVKYTVRIKPLVSQGGYYWRKDEEGVRPVTVQKVENLVRVDAEHVEDSFAKAERERLERDRSADADRY